MLYGSTALTADRIHLIDIFSLYMVYLVFTLTLEKMTGLLPCALLAPYCKVYIIEKWQGDELSF